MQINELFTLDVSAQKEAKSIKRSKYKTTKKIEELYDFPTALDIFDTHADNNLSCVTSTIQFGDVSSPGMFEMLIFVLLFKGC